MMLSGARVVIKLNGQEIKGFESGDIVISHADETLDEQIERKAYQRDLERGWFEYYIANNEVDSEA